MQQTDLVRVQHQNVMTVNTEVQRGSQGPLSMEEVLKEYPDVFQGAGKLKGQYKLEIEIKILSQWSILPDEYRSRSRES